MHRLIIILFLLILTSSTIVSAEVPFDNRKFYLHKNIDELNNFKWGNFLHCLKTVKFPDDAGPRELDKKISRLVKTTINDRFWVFSVREDDSNVTLESITINTHKYYSLKEKRRLF